METITIQLPIENLEIDSKTGNLIININGDALKGLMGKDDKVVEKGGRKYKKSRFSVFMEWMIDKLLSKGKKRSAEAYQTTLNSFMAFRNNEDIYLYEIKAPLIERYQAWLKRKGVTLNTISFYMRIMRTAYNNAVEYNLTSDMHPFRKVYTGIAKTTKRSVTLEVMKEIRHFATDDPNIAFARDMFLFSFYTRGMSFVDMSYLKTTDIVDGMLHYARKKTGQEIDIEWTTELQEIVDRNPSCNEPYLLPIIKKSNGKERNQKRYKQTVVNENLKKISKTLQLKEPLTMYVARHTWASLARDTGIPLKTISLAMGHESEKTTQIYLKNLDVNAVDRANREIINLINT
ncbi:MAG: tyrosine-type recombinase/integrase [Prevotella sp.]